MSPAFLPSFLPSDFPGEITLDQVIPGAAAEFAPLPPEMRPELAAALAARGIVRLYTHQADAYRAVRNGRHLVVVTPTASGKTLCYNLPVLQRLLENPERRALYVYPTKALAQDQLAELSALKHGLPIDVRVDTYDGDTAPGRRTAIREAGHKNVHYFRSMREGIEYLLKQARPGDALLTIGAGNISRASNEFMVLLGTEHPTPHAHS